ncbi:MAG: phosphoglucosamine mutase [Oscillospiraceae bacterium]|jgi:phosphoglucosamine mutase|nr:phosphoglucosamine mutase [Oscillospiraceae bacterium]
MGRLFGTDGIRGLAGTELTAELAMKLGAVLGDLLPDKAGAVLLARDTRRSGAMLAQAIAAGLMSVGVDVTDLGILPTPAVAYLVQKNAAAAGVMITASHNPADYNGIKIFGADGRKLPDAVEDSIESHLLRGNFCAHTDIGSVRTLPDPAAQYGAHLRTQTAQSFHGLRLALDCANGAASRTAEALFTSLGAEVLVLGDTPDGENINKDCGSLHPERLQELVLAEHCAAGFAFDGDADRVLAVDERGALVDGDGILALCALDMQARGALTADTLVATVMSNFGLGVFCRAHGIALRTTDVGDRWVSDAMHAGGYALGGEQSGHIIIGRGVGDGQRTAVTIVDIMVRTGQSLSALADVMEHYPQVLVNIPVSLMGKARLRDDAVIAEAVAEAEQLLGEEGRVLLRVSGTEPLVRVMVEGRDEKQIDTIARELESVVRAQLL